MEKWEDMTEKAPAYKDSGYQNARIALLVSIIALLLSISGFWIDAEYWNAVAITTSVATIIPLILGMKEKESPYLLWSALGISICAIMLQYWMIAMLILFILAVIVTILSFFGVPLS